jgi:hypothetical protein
MQIFRDVSRQQIASLYVLIYLIGFVALICAHTFHDPMAVVTPHDLFSPKS